MRKQKLISMILAIMMIVMSIPFSAFAEGSASAAEISDVSGGEPEPSPTPTAKPVPTATRAPEAETPNVWDVSASDVSKSIMGVFDPEPLTFDDLTVDPLPVWTEKKVTVEQGENS